MAVVIGKQRLPSLEILGREWAYNIFESSRAKDFIKVVGVLKKTKDATLIRDIKSAIAEIFVEGVQLVKEINAVYGDNAFLWTDALLQILEEIKNPKLKDLSFEIEKLKGK